MLEVRLVYAVVVSNDLVFVNCMVVVAVVVLVVGGCLLQSDCVCSGWKICTYFSHQCFFLWSEKSDVPGM